MALSALFFLILSNVLGGSSYVAMARAMHWMAPQDALFWRTALGAVFLAPALLRLRGRRPSRGAWLRMAAVGLLGLAAPLAIGTIGQGLSSATNASLLVGFEPISIVVLSALFLRERLTWLKAGAIASGLAGSACIVLQGGFHFTPHLRGGALLFLHGFLWALYSVIGKQALKEVEPAAFSAVTTLIALAPMGFFAMARNGGLPPPGAWPALLYLGLCVTWIGTWSWNKALEVVPASKLANFVFLQPLVGVVLGICLENGRLTAGSAVGGALILLGMYAASREPEVRKDERQGLRVREVLDVPQGS